MTRINLIPVQFLKDQHLLAEHREIVRIPNLIKSWKYNLDWIPKEYTMWKWHVKFFYNKLKFLYKRYLDLFIECKYRWFNVQFYWLAFEQVPMELMNDFEYSSKDILISSKRIQEKIKQKPNFYTNKRFWNIDFV